METERASDPVAASQWDRSDAWVAGGLALLTAPIRLAFTAFQELPTFDPWRHLLLVENLEAGRGFQLFEDQPYLWYQPIWHRFAAWMPGSLNPGWWAALLSILAVPIFYLLLRSRAWALSRSSAAVGALLLCLFAPVTAFTCHYGSEALALLLALLGLLLPSLSHGRRASGWTALGGLLFGVALLTRLNFAFLVLLGPAVARGPKRLATWAAGIALPMLAGWWRNRSILGAHDWVFAWDGMAIPSNTFNPWSSFFLQMHPDIKAGLSELHRQIQPQAEWLRLQDDLRLGLIAFMIVGALAVAFCRNAWVTWAGVGTLVYLLVFDSTLSANFFRIYLGLFPVYFLAFALVAEQFRARSRHRGKMARWFCRIGVPAALVVFVAVTGTPYWKPARMATLEQATPPPAFFDGADHFAVNSGFYQPESLIYRYRNKSFIGLPMNQKDFPEFQSAFPEFEETIWQPFNVQIQLHRFVSNRGECDRPAPGRNGLGMRYERIRCSPTPP